MTFLRGSNWLFEVSKATIPGHRLLSRSGNNPAVLTAGVPADIWRGGGLYAGFNAVEAQRQTIVSDSAQDGPGGTGGLTVHVTGLDADYNEISELVVLNGLTPVLTQLEYVRSDLSAVKTAGSTTTNLGTIIAAQETSGYTMWQIPPLRGRTHVAAYTVPAGHTAFIFEAGSSVTVSQNVETDIDLMIREYGEAFNSHLPFSLAQTGGPFVKNSHPIAWAKEKADIVLRVFRTTVNSTEVFGSFDAVVIENEYLRDIALL